VLAPRHQHVIDQHLVGGRHCQAEQLEQQHGADQRAQARLERPQHAPKAR
jgi:hypothetical protein